MENLQITLNLTLAEVEYILRRIMDGPYREVGVLVPKIQNQAQVQVDAARSPAPEPAPVPQIVSDETFAALRERARNGALPHLVAEPAPDLQFKPE